MRDDYDPETLPPLSDHSDGSLCEHAIQMREMSTPWSYGGPSNADPGFTEQDVQEWTAEDEDADTLVGSEEEEEETNDETVS